MVTYDPTTGALSGASVSLGGHGYPMCWYEGKVWLVHRLAFLLMGEEIPIEVDHINGNRSDNRWCNLRAVTRTEQNRNTCRSKNNTSGVTGVSWDKRNNRWRATIWENSKQVSLGYYNCFLDAVATRKRAEREYGYHENHGRVV